MPELTSSTDNELSESDSRTDAVDHSSRNRLVITLLLISAFVVILNETIMGVAIPHLMTDLSISANAAQWLSTAFMLTMAVVIPVTGFLLQRYNTRPVFIAAMLLFSTGTLVAALAPGFEVLLAGRVVQASGTAIMMPLLFTTVLNLVPPASRGRVIGNISIVISVAPAIGPTISGVILNYLEWRWMFILVLPIAIAALLIGAKLMVNVTEPTTANIDVLSVVLAALGFGGLVFGLTTVTGSSNALGAVTLAAGAVFLGLFIWRQLVLQRSDSALLDLRTFTSGTFTVAMITVSISMIALFGTIILLPMYAINVLGLEPVQVGLILLPGGLVMGLLAPFVGRIYDKRGPRLLLIPGSIIVSAVLWSMTLLSETSSMWMLLAAHVTLSLGLALLFTPLFTAGLASVKPHLYSHASAIVGTVQQLAGAAGTALFVTVMSAVAASTAGGGEASPSDIANGIQASLTIGAVISMFAIVAVFFIKKPVEDPDAQWGGGH